MYMDDDIIKYFLFKVSIFLVGMMNANTEIRTMMSPYLMGRVTMTLLRVCPYPWSSRRPS